MKIKTTKLNESIKDNNYIKFINIVNEVIPLNVEEEYVNLSNDIISYNNYNISYNNNIKLLEDINNKITYLKNNYDIFSNKKKLLLNELNNINNSLNVVFNPKINFSVDLWQIKKNELESEINKISLKIEKINIEINKEEEKRNNITTIKEKNKEQLIRIVKTFNNNDLEMLNTSNLLLKHIIKLRNIDLEKEELKLLEDIFKKYIYIRILIFNFMKETASNILLNYKIDSNFININTKKFNIISKSLLNFDLTKYNYLFDVLYNPLSISNLKLMELILDYLYNKDIDLNKIKKETKNMVVTKDNVIIKELVKKLEKDV